ncbi:MAG: Hvo_1808 family surface protein [Haloplanus sp.]
MRKRVSVALAVLLVLAAIAPAAVASDGASAVEGDEEVVQQRADPDGDTVGWEDGYWHDDQLEVDQSNGLSDEEIDAYVARAMARVEYIRQEEFESDVPVEVLSREEFQTQRNQNVTSNASYDAWNDQVWEALFIIGEDAEANSELRGATGQTTAGFYAPGDDRIRIITDSPDSPTIDNATLVHELTHALQDQNGELGEQISSTETQDAGLATDGVVEGEANYIERRYTERCSVEWDCVETPSSGPSGNQEPPNLGILLTLLHPYSDGPVYVDWLRQQGGWEAVDAAFQNPPESTEQVIHLTDDEPTPIEYEDRARDGWETFPEQGEDGSDTVGEASMYVMFWYQARIAGAQTVPPRSVVQTSSPLDMYNYDAEPSAGWGNDRVFPYHKETGDDAQYGYVWVTEWDTEQDAAQFHNAYRAILDAHDAQSQGENTYVIQNGEFADAFRIDRQGTRVTIVNAPTADALSELRPADTSGGDGSSDAGGSGEGESTGTTAAAGGEDEDSTGLEAPGFGPLTAVLALIAAVALAATARRLD